MAEPPQRSRSPSPHEDGAQDPSSDESLSDAADAQGALGGNLSDSDVSREQIELEDLGVEVEGTPPEDSSPQQQRSESSDSSGRPLFLERIGEMAGRVGNHVLDYRYVYFFFFLVAFFVAFLIGYFIDLTHNDPRHQQRPRPPIEHIPPPLVTTKQRQHGRPWYERTSDHGLPRILVWNRPTAESYVTYDHAVCPTKFRRNAVCDVTDDRNALPRSDAVVFNDDRLTTWGLPFYRMPFQRWVFWSKRRVSPDEPVSVEEEATFRRLRHQINWTMGWRGDADVVLPYKTWHCRVPMDESLAKSAKQPSVAKRDIAWILSSCERRRLEQKIRFATRQRGDNYTATADRISIQVFPSCGRKHCSQPRECISHIAKNYHFVVVTMDPDCFRTPYELIYEAFLHDVVPIVLAHPGATIDVPPNSVVSSSDLQDAGELAEHLRHLLNNRSLYESYFDWKKTCSFSAVPSEDEFCPLCRALVNTPVRDASSYDDVHEWWTRAWRCRNASFYGLDEGFDPMLVGEPAAQ
ncbi:hypothetical protein HPB50_011894 [Hyalomma asiaticum]|uniref:Uncharacterized protein n=1 Tax=Hyalomma asiaticum TaxID=266040 RepID=A0ACB7SH56_HYAAI|nr:hypothetical protein HPB50_011894 [Hyalomma asiaticum]